MLMASVALDVATCVISLLLYSLYLGSCFFIYNWRINHCADFMEAAHKTEWLGRAGEMHLGAWNTEVLWFGLCLSALCLTDSCSLCLTDNTCCAVTGLDLFQLNWLKVEVFMGRLYSPGVRGLFVWPKGGHSVCQEFAQSCMFANFNGFCYRRLLTFPPPTAAPSRGCFFHC